MDGYERTNRIIGLESKEEPHHTTGGIDSCMRRRKNGKEWKFDSIPLEYVQELFQWCSQDSDEKSIH